MENKENKENMKPVEKHYVVMETTGGKTKCVYADSSKEEATKIGFTNAEDQDALLEMNVRIKNISFLELSKRPGGKWTIDYSKIAEQEAKVEAGKKALEIDEAELQALKEIWGE